MVVEVVARVQVDGGSSVEQLVCHPRLPLVAGLDSSRPAVHVWDSAGLREAGTVGAESVVYGDAEGWQRRKRIPAVAWHPDQPLLLVAVEGTVMRWTPAGLSELEGVPASYLSLAFSPDGRTLWASPSSGEGDDAWERSDVIDLATGTVDTGPGWDTGVATHPAGGLVVTLSSDQGATHGLFARADHKMRVLRRALILDADGYRTPIFSPDGRHLAIRGNSYENSLEVFEFPSLRRVLAATLGEPAPDYPYPDEWYEQFEAWSPHNIAFGSQPGVIWVGTPTGTLVEVDIDSRAAAEHDVLAGSKVTGLAATATGELIVAGSDGDLVLVSCGSAPTTASRDTVTAFLETTSEVPDEGRLETHLVVTDGTRAWHKDDLASVTTADETDPGWLQLQAAINNETGPAEG